MFSIAFVKQDTWKVTVAWVSDGGTTEHCGVYFYAEGDQAKNQTTPEFTQSMETSRHFPSLDVQ